MWVDQMVDQFSTYIYQKRGFYYFSKRIPKQLQHCHGKQRIVFALKTKSRAKALKYAQVICQRLDERWLPMRLDAMGLGNVLANDVTSSDAPKLSEALQDYLQLEGVGKSKTFHQASVRSAGVVIEVCGDKACPEYRPTDAGLVRDTLIDRGLSVASVRRSFNTIKAIFNLAIAEHGLDMRNPFASIFMPEGDSKKRASIPVDTIREVQQSCYVIDDDMRWLVALISDTGMRLAEAAGLQMDDLCLDKGGEREIPLVVASLWAAKRIVTNGHQFAFPVYTNSAKCSANSASAALNKWLKSRTPSGCVIHSFRHSLRDRLRAVECPPDVADAIGGWASMGVGQKYGAGFTVKQKNDWISKIALSRVN